MKTAVSASILALALLAGCSPAPAESPEAVAELDTETAAAEAPAPESALEAAIASSRLEQAHHVLCYIDLDRYGRDLRYDYTVVDTGDGGVFVFQEA